MASELKEVLIKDLDDAISELNSALIDLDNHINRLTSDHLSRNDRLPGTAKVVNALHEARTFLTIAVYDLEEEKEFLSFR